MNMLYSPEGRQATNHGVYGEDWVWVDGVITHTDAWHAKTLSERNVRFFGPLAYFPSVQSWDWARLHVHPFAAEAQVLKTMNADTSRTLPMLTFSSEEQEAINAVMPDINTIVQETLNRVLIGTAPLSDLQVMQDRIRAMGIDRAIEAHQSAFDRVLEQGIPARRPLEW